MEGSTSSKLTQVGSGFNFDLFICGNGQILCFIRLSWCEPCEAAELDYHLLGATNRTYSAHSVVEASPYLIILINVLLSCTDHGGCTYRRRRKLEEFHHCFFSEWDYIYDQKNLHDKEKVYLKGKDKIVPPFRFGVEDVATKMWFHKLAYPGQCLTNSHLDIIFYYLRKKGKYAKEPKVKFTTTDCLFFKTIHALYEKFIAQKKNLSLITAQHAIADYIRGRKMLCGSPWHLCDHVFFIIHMETESHWILGRLNIEERRVYMYNSLSTAMKDSAAIKACQPFAVLLPHFFALFDEFKKENKPICLDPFEVVKVDGLPQQTSNDCGCFVASFAEYFIDMKPIPPIFDVEKHRDRLAVLFYKYARMKEVEFIDSEDEAPPKGPKKNLS
ncbi:hypothetical protein G4B88_016317 [Cannabis sativa]|uniref:Ubiquitin-like protease family profile domain-containing protein n=1 Tax=Cannabis sativa TaxID=3483 RepID=A0A7J6GLT2_CANSA|nr:hypothetical protein G4B88_016317 [Cannabis sativa]